MSNNKEEEKRIAKLYETALDVKKSDDLKLPKGMTASELRKYVQDMIKINQPRHIRDEGRPSFSIDDYKVPVNYFIVDSNTVSYHSAKGPIFIDPDDFDDYMNTAGSNVKESVPNKFREDDIGQQVVLHIFKHGRKTVDELIADLKGLDKHMLFLLTKRLVSDGYLQLWKGDKEGRKKIQTLELVPKQINKALSEKKHDDEQQKRGEREKNKEQKSINSG